MAALTTNTVPKATDGTHIGDSRITDDGTNPVTITGNTSKFQLGQVYADLSAVVGSNAPAVLIGGDDVTSFQGASLVMASDSNDASPPQFSALSSQGTIASPSASSDGNDLLRLYALGYDGSDFLLSTGIKFTVSGSPTSGHVPGKITLFGNENGTSLVMDDGSAKTITATATTKIDLACSNVTLSDAAYHSLVGLATDSNGKIIVVASDARLKDVSADFTQGLEAIEQLHPKEFTWKDGRAEGTQAGLIAQEVQEVIPWAVSAVDDEIGTLQINKDAIIATLINAVKELSARVKELENPS